MQVPWGRMCAQPQPQGFCTMVLSLGWGQGDSQQAAPMGAVSNFLGGGLESPPCLLAPGRTRSPWWHHVGVALHECHVVNSSARQVLQIHQPQQLNLRAAWRW